jgi:hypothetical protein
MTGHNGSPVRGGMVEDVMAARSGVENKTVLLQKAMTRRGLTAGSWFITALISNTKPIKPAVTGGTAKKWEFSLTRLSAESYGPHAR